MHIHRRHLFSPLGKLADWAIYFTFCNFFLTGAQLSQDILDRFSRFSPSERYLYELYRSGHLFLISKWTLSWQPIFGKISEMAFIRQIGISKWMRISQFQFTGVKWHYFCYTYAILMKIGPVTPEIMRVEIVPFWTRSQKSGYHTIYLSKYAIDRHQHFSIGRHMYGDYKLIQFSW